ncbi:MAG: PEP-CTERM sorting domain-containing protein [Candidatus Solibacter sp.]
MGTILALAIVGLFGASPASATVYQFAIPISDLQAALDAAASASAGGPSPARFGFYDIYIRAAQTGDSGVTCTSTTCLASPFNTAGTPLATNNTPQPDAWTDIVNGTNIDNDNIPAFGDSHLSIHFKASALDTTVRPVFTSNTNAAVVNGTTIDGKTTKSMNLAYPSGQMAVYIGSNSGYLGQSIQLEFYAIAYKFSDITWSNAASLNAGNKAVLLTGHLSETAQAAPEPASMLISGGGILLLALVARRKRQPTRL